MLMFHYSEKLPHVPQLVSVGTPVTRCPPNRSGHEVFPHPAPRLYSLPLKAVLIIYMRPTFLFGDSWFPNTIVLFEASFKALPRITSPLASSIQPFKADFENLIVIFPYRLRIPSNTIVIVMTTKFGIDHLKELPFR